MNAITPVVKPPGRIETTTDGAVASIVLHNAARLNAISLSMWKALEASLDAVANNDAVRCVLVRGEGGKAFASGADISEFGENRSGSEAVELYDRTARAALSKLAAFPKPTIAVIDGYCIGGGLALALSCDLRFATPASSFGIPAAKLGLGYDIHGIQKLVGIAGVTVAKLLFFSARRFKAAEALRFGLITDVLPADEIGPYVSDLAMEIAGNAPMTIAAAKFGINRATAPLSDDVIERCTAAERACFASEDYREGQRAFLEKRRPVFTGR